MVTRDSDGRHPNGSESENRENSQNLGRCNFKELYWPSSEGDQHNLSHSPKVNDQVSAQDRSLWETSRFILYSILYAALKQRGEGWGEITSFLSIPLLLSTELSSQLVSGSSYVTVFRTTVLESPSAKVSAVSSSLSSLYDTVVLNTNSSALLPGFRNMSICR